MRRKILGIFILAAVILAGCSSAAAPAIPVTATTTATLQASMADTPASPSSAATTTVTPHLPVSGDDVRAYIFDPEKTIASYQVDEVFINENNRLNTAIGKTSEVNGEVQLNFTHPWESTVGQITVDISTLKSDSSRRDNSIRSRWLESQRYPLAVFTPTSISGLPTQYEMGSEIQFQINGNLTIHDTTNPVVFDVTAKLDGDTLIGTATTHVKMSDFGFSAPDIAGMLKANNDAILSLDFTATAG